VLHNGDGSGLAGRLVGLSERVQAVQFSPMEWLAVAGGNPARLGEIQVWDVAKRKLAVSAPVAYDTLYGVSWSPDSRLIAFGCPDNTVRAIEAETGKQVVQMGSHSDWALSTTFSVKGDHIISGGRDMSVKLTEVASQRFIDNVTSITPGALKGGVLSLATSHHRAHRDGRLGWCAQSIGFPRDEARSATTRSSSPISFRCPAACSACASAPTANALPAATTLTAREVLVCSYDYTSDVPKELRDSAGKVPGNRTPEERKQLKDYRKEGIRELSRMRFQFGHLRRRVRPNSNTIAAAGSDGMVRFFDAASERSRTLSCPN
jgi:WD40 repeat protein